MASDLERAIRASKRYEAALSRLYGATGRGLHEKADSVAHRLEGRLARDLHLIATVRNKLVHEEGYDRIDDESSFRAATKRADKALKISGARTGKWLIAIGLGAMVLGAGWFVVTNLL